ncbi:GH92 family glycosyl hydrolase [Chitinophaga sp. GCM10012297]|uniref:GH92 family glycosyl hydrolase n=1 Tax=Chitinophaga chungangae TaxID=2821488 RepID=A0ABS3YFM0_9BACT|nr:GH92 family glycosyl hydrolase [Chitinophaga chungangae]MBO9153470.1 GH92 family glycosyl hydrolase [Chitinophaga chungangae]
MLTFSDIYKNYQPNKKFNMHPGYFLRITALIILSIVCETAAASWQDSLLRFVQPLIGTAASTTVASAIHGKGTEQYANTIPAVGVPFGMTQWTPQTRTSEQKCRPPYQYKDSLLSGFRGTHWLSGSCTQDYGSFTVMPVTGRLRLNVSDYATPFSHDEEYAAPHYYSVKLNEYNLLAEITALARSSVMRFTMEKDDSLHLLVTPNSDQGRGFVKINRSKNQVEGYNPAHRIYQGWGKPAGFSGYFVVKAEIVPVNAGTFSGGNSILADSLVQQAGIGAYFSWKLPKGTKVIIRIGTSFTSIREAEKNLQAEISGRDFEAVKSQSAAIWEKALRKIEVTNAGDRSLDIFYTALYHTMQQPRLFSDASGTYPAFSRQYETARLSEGNYYDDFSMWDIYRTMLPLYEIIDPALISDFVRSMILKGQQGGWLPIFPCWNSYTSAMIGDHVTPFIASAYLKGIRGYDVKAAYALMRRNAFETPDTAEYSDGKGRRALKSYLQYGYVPLEDGVPDAFHKKEQVSRTLEYAYDDHALSLVAKALGKKEDYRRLAASALNYRHVFDTGVGFVRGRYANGSWYTPFDPDKRAPYITEGTPRQYTWYVPHNIEDLIRLKGGKKAFESALDDVFRMKEYWHGNEPGHQVPFLYNYTESPWKTQREVRNILASEYTSGPGGLSGNDDAGQMSAWYVMAAIGLYPVSPVSGQYALCSPLFDTVTLRLKDDREFRIVTQKETTSSMYISSITLNQQPHSGYQADYSTIMKGGTMEIRLADRPSTALPVSPRKKDIRKLMEKVADWQIKEWETEEKKQRMNHWVNATGLTGLLALADISKSKKYIRYVRTTSEAMNWQPGPQRFFADDYCIGQVYAQLYAIYKKPEMIAPWRALADSILNKPNNESLEWKDGSIRHREWSWCDALYMGPPALSYLASATGNPAYLDLASRLWWKTTDYLYAPEEQLFFRDSRYFAQREKNGKEVFWSRGNGWVIAGLVRVLENMPPDHPDRARFIKLFHEMSEKLARIQQPDGSWHASLLDPDSYDIKETSGTGFFCYALLWGMNHGLLDKKTYGPVAKNAWSAMVSSVTPDGKPGYVQPIGAAPNKVNAESTEAYGTGALLLAGAQMYRFLENAD